VLICLGDTPVIRTSAAFSGSVGSAAAKGRGVGGEAQCQIRVRGSWKRADVWRSGGAGWQGKGEKLTWVFEVLEQPVLEDADGLRGQVPLPPPVQH
jgi:hypothetical protein